MPQVGTIHKLAGSKYLSLYQMDAVQRDGTHFDYYMASRIGDAARLKAATKENHADGVVIFAADDQDRIVLIRQYRYPVGRFVYELPAGLVEPGEDPRQAAVRELFEETGIRAEPEEFTLIDSGSDRNTHYDYYILIRDTPLEEVKLLPGETDAAQWVTFAQVHELIRKKAICRIIAKQFLSQEKMIPGWQCAQKK